MNIQIEPLSQCWNEIMNIANEHWKETEKYRHNQPFCPSFERYNQYNEAGWYFMVTVRDEGKLVGYSGNYISQSMHTQQLLCVEDTYFLLEEYRKGRNAIKLYKFVEQEAVKRGAIEMMMTVKITNQAGRILEYLDFKKVGMQYSKSIGCADSAEINAVPEKT